MALNETHNSHVNFHPYNYNQNQNHGIQQQYPNVQYKWEMTEWSECNNLCDGEQFRTATCTQIDNGRSASTHFCRDKKPDDEYQICNAGCAVE